MVSDEQLLEDLKEFAEEITETPTKRQMNNSGPWDESTYRKYFGSWNDALAEADLEVNKEHSVSEEKLIEDLQEFADELGDIPTKEQMREFGPWSAKAYDYRFGSWSEALQKCGLRINYGVSEKQLLEELREFTDELGKIPTIIEMNKLGPWHAGTYQKHFGSWNDALVEADLEINNEFEFVESKEKIIEDLQEFAEELGGTPTQMQMRESGPWSDMTYKYHMESWNNALKKADLEINCLENKDRAGTSEEYYGKDYKQKRSETLERDKYICRVCEATDDLHCHHIKPRREFDDVNDSNTLDNLITLCRSCHRTFEGKWKEASPDEFAERAKEYRTETTT